MKILWAVILSQRIERQLMMINEICRNSAIKYKAIGENEGELMSLKGEYGRWHGSMRKPLTQWLCPFAALIMLSCGNALLAQSSEGRTDQASTLAPRIVSDKGDRQVEVTIAMGETPLGTLIMGQSTQSEALTVAPAYQGYGPTKPGVVSLGFISDEARTVTDKVRRVYNPAFTQSILGFDKHKKLVFVKHRMFASSFKKAYDEIKSLTELREIHRTADQVVNQGHLTPCVFVETWFTSAKEYSDFETGTLEIFYTCRTTN